MGNRLLASALSENTRLVLATNASLPSKRAGAGVRCKELVLRSVERKFGLLPAEAKRFLRFEGFDGRVSAEKTSIEDLEIWAIRFSEPDKSVPGRDWIVDITTMTRADVDMVSCRLSCYSTVGNFSFSPSTPGALKEIVGEMSVHNSGYIFPSEPIEIGLDASIKDVMAQIYAPDRWWNVIVVADSGDSRHGFDASEILRSVMGCAVVFRLPVNVEAAFTQAIGMEYRVFGGGARTYRPGFTESAASVEHPVLRSPPFKKRWMMERGNFILATDAFRSSVSRTNVANEAPSFLTVRQIVARNRASEAENLGNEQIIDALRHQLTTEKEQTEAGLQLALQEQEARKQFEAELETERAANFRLKARIRNLEASFGNIATPKAQRPRPSSYFDLISWVEEEYAGRLSLHSRAKKSLKSAQYHDIEHVIEGLGVLANEYRDARLSIGVSDRRGFEKRIAELGFSESKSASRSTAGKQGDQYTVTHSGQKRFLERHLKKGNSKDPKYCLRSYYFFDENTEEVVVGYLPDHLDTLST